METIRIGILRETKVPPDRRVALPPEKIIEVSNALPNVEFVVQPSNLRCFSDEEYSRLGIALKEDLSDCDILIGVKEVLIEALIPDKTYMFFSHVAKEQPYNRSLLQAVLKKRIHLIDYEYLTDNNGIRLIAFGRWAGIVGAYNILRGLGIYTGDYELKPAHDCHDRQEMNAQLDAVVLNKTRILVSGGGRVAHGAMETLNEMEIRQVTPEEYIAGDFNEAVFCRIDPWHYAAHNDGKEFDLQHFFHHPKEYHSTALPYLQRTDLFIAAHYWDPESPRMFELREFRGSGNRGLGIKVIADISCDINGSIPSTLRATTIADPFYWFDIESGTEVADNKDRDGKILMMTVDNLPGELPRDSSDEFSSVLVKEILPRMLNDNPDGVIDRASIAKDGKLTEHFSYLENYVKGQ